MTTSDASVSAQSVVSTHLWANASSGIGVSYNPSHEPGEGTLNGPAVIQGAIATWNSVVPSSFAFVNKGTTAAEAGSCDATIHLDGVNTIAFAPLDGQLAITCAVFLGSGATSQLVEFDMKISEDASLWASSLETPAGRFDLPSTVLHELGHAAGLSHSDAGTVMDGTLAPGVQRRNLTADDIAGLQTAYPVKPVAIAAEVTKPGKPLFRLRAALVAFD
ncbi:MAG: matrixin family metalloprotease [bacterium]